MLKTRKVVSVLLVVAMLAAMLVVGISATSAAGRDFYLTGTVANWGMDENFVLTADGDWFAIEDVTLTTDDAFKFIQASKSGEEIATWFPDGMGNDQSVAEAGVYTILFMPETLELPDEDWVACDGPEHDCVYKITKTADAEPATEAPTTEPAEDPTGEIVPVDTITVTVTDGNEWGSVNVHYWGNGETSWPGAAMTDNGDGTFSAEVPAGVTGFVFNTGDGSPQTVDVQNTEGFNDDVAFVISTETNPENGNYLVDYAEDEEATEPATEPAEEPTTPATDPAEEPTDAPVEGGDAQVTIDGVPYDAHVGDTIHYVLTLDLSAVETDLTGILNELEGYTYFDHEKLALTTTKANTAMPNCVGGMKTFNDDGEKLGYGAVAIGEDGYDFSEEKVLLQLDFEVIGAGSSEITNVIESLGSGETKVIEVKEVKTPVAPTFEASVEVECPHTEPTEPAEEPTTPATEPAEEPTTAPVSGQSTITVIDISGAESTHVVEIDDVITVTVYLSVPADKKVNSIDFTQEFNIDAEMVELIPDISKKATAKEVFPAMADSLPTRNVDGNIIKVNASQASYDDAYEFPENTVLMTVQYKVIAEGNSKIKSDIITLATIDEEDAMTTQINKGEKVGDDDIDTATVVDAPLHEEPTEPATEPAEEPTTPATEPAEEPTTPATEPAEEPTTPAEEPTEVVIDGVLICADGVYYQVQQGDIFVYKFYLNTGELVCSLDGTTVYDTAGLELQSTLTGNGKKEVFPIFGKSALINETPAGTLLFNYSSADGEEFTTDDSEMIVLKFLVTAESGVYCIDTDLKVVAGADEHKYIFDGEVVDDTIKYDSELTDEAGEEIEPYDGPVPTPVEPTEPAVEPTEPAEEPTEPAEEPTTPAEEPTEPAEEPTEPAEEPTAEPEAPTATSHVDDGQDTPDNPTSPKTGSTEMAVIFLMVIVLSAGVVFVIKKRRFN